MPRSTALARRLSLALALLLLPSIGSAHTGLRRSDPAKGSRLTVAPTRISLWFSARPQLGFSRIRLAGPGGDVALGPLASDTGNLVRATILQTLPPGDYTIHWQTASADGHPIRGELSFAIVDANAGIAAQPIADTTHAQHVPQPETHAAPGEYRTVRWIEFVALITILGVLGFRHAVLPSLASRAVPTADAGDRARRFGQSALVLYGIAAVVRLYTESSAIHGAAGALDPAQLRLMLGGTIWGIGWTFGVMGAISLFIGWTISKRHVAIGTPLALTGGFLIVLSPSLSGHAAAGSPFVLSVTLDALHVAAAGVWVGGLLMVLIAGLPAMRRVATGNADTAVAALVNSFHPVALFCAPIVVIAGTGSSWLRLGGASALFGTPYGRTLLIKVGLFALVALMGLHNWLRGRRKLGTEDGTRRIRLTGSIELVLASLVLAITTMLVVTPVPAEMPSP